MRARSAAAGICFCMVWIAGMLLQPDVSYAARFDVVMAGTGAHGIALTGAIEKLEAHGHQVGRIVATSGSSVLALLVAAGYPPQEILAVLAEQRDGTPRLITWFGPGRQNGEQLFMDWMQEKLQAKGLRGDITFSAFHRERGIDLSLLAWDMTDGERLVLNHRTAPDLPVPYAVRMAFSIPEIFSNVVWRKEWGRYLGRQLEGHEIVDASVRPTLPMELIAASDDATRKVMGDNSDPTASLHLGLVVDPNLAVPNEPRMRPEPPSYLRTDLRKSVQILDARAAGWTEQPEYQDAVCRLPGRSYSVAEFAMDGDRQYHLIQAARDALDRHLQNRGPIPQPGRRATSTATLAEDIRQALHKELPGADISVEASERTVTLTGAVASEEVRRKAEGIAQGFGRAVDNRLRVSAGSTSASPPPGLPAWWPLPAALVIVVLIGSVAVRRRRRRRNPAASAPAALGKPNRDLTAEVAPVVGPDQAGASVGTVFLSYSWDSPEHKTWVRNLAARLRNDGVEAILDQFHLDLGLRLPQFMETAVGGSRYVLVICTEGYKHRFDNRRGNAGYEGHIISGSLVDSAGSSRIIPVLRSGTWTTAIPSALIGIIGADLRGDPYSEDEYQALLRKLRDEQRRIPPVKRPPKWLNSE